MRIRARTLSPAACAALPASLLAAHCCPQIGVSLLLPWLLIAASEDVGRRQVRLRSGRVPGGVRVGAAAALCCEASTLGVLPPVCAQFLQEYGPVYSHECEEQRRFSPLAAGPADLWRVWLWSLGVWLVLVLPASWMLADFLARVWLAARGG